MLLAGWSSGNDNTQVTYAYQLRHLLQQVHKREPIKIPPEVGTQRKLIHQTGPPHLQKRTSPQRQRRWQLPQKLHCF